MQKCVSNLLDSNATQHLNSCATVKHRCPWAAVDAKMSIVLSVISRFLFRLSEVLPDLPASLELLSDNLVPVLAIGSNGSPQQLARKFPASKFPSGVLIPVVRAVLEDFDVVYAPLIAAYGACAGTLSLRHH